VFSQEPESGRNLVTNYKSIEVGFAYPLLTRSHRSVTLIETHFNHGMRIGFNWGRLYDSGYSISFSPSIIYVSVPNTVHTRSYGKPKEIAVEYQNVSWAFPVMLEKPFFFKGKFGAGLSIVIPMMSTGKYNESDIDLSFIPNNDPFRDKPYARLSFLLKSTFPLFQTETRQNFISFEYLHYLHHNQQSRSDEKLFSVTFIHRQLKIKEKRFKWDHALMKKEKQD